MSDSQGKAFDFAQEAVKQLLTLATGIVALTVTFLKDIASQSPQNARDVLSFAWLLYVVSVAFGLMTLLTLAGNLERPESGRTPSIYRANIAVPATLQVVCFGVGLLLTVAFGWMAGRAG